MRRILTKLPTMAEDDFRTPMIISPKFHDFAYQHFSQNGHFLKMDQKLLENIYKIQNYVEGMNYCIDLQRTIVFSSDSIQIKKQNLKINFENAIWFIESFKKIFSSEEIQKFLIN